MQLWKPENSDVARNFPQPENSSFPFFGFFTVKERIQLIAQLPTTQHEIQCGPLNQMQGSGIRNWAGALWISGKWQNDSAEYSTSFLNMLLKLCE